MTALVQISDLHFGVEDPVLVGALEEKIAELNPHAVAVSGDITQKGRRREFEAAAAFLDRLPYPKLIAPGNHDTPVFNIFARVTNPWGRYQKRISPGAVPGFSGEHLVAHTLNTARGVQMRLDWSLGVVDLHEAKTVAGELATAPPQFVRAVICHHPLLTPAAAPFAPRTRKGEAAAKLFVEHGIDLVLTGHLHVAFAEALPFGDGLTWAVGSGTALSRRLRGAPASFNAITIEHDCIRVQMFHADGQRFHLAAEHDLVRRARDPSQT